MAFRNWLNLMGHFLSFFKCCGLGLFLRLMRFLRFRSRLICAEFDDPTNESLDLGHYPTIFSSNLEDLISLRDRVRLLDADIGRIKRLCREASYPLFSSNPKPLRLGARLHPHPKHFV